MKKQKVARGSFHIFISQLISLASRGFFIFFVARILGPDRYGQFAAVFALCLILQVLFRAGLAGSTNKAIASGAEDVYAVVRFGFFSQCIWAALISLAVFLFAGPVSAHLFNDVSLAPYLKVAALHFVPFALSAVGYAILSGLGEFTRAAALLSSLSILQILTVASFLLISPSVQAVYIALFAASALNLISLKALMPKLKKSREKVNKRRVLLLALSLVLSALAMRAVFQVDKLFIKNMIREDSIVGFYALASNVSYIMLPFVTAIAATLYPAAAASYARDNLERTRTYLRQGTRYLFLCLIPAACALTLIGRDAIPLIFGQEYARAASPLGILICSAVFFSFFILYRQLLVSLDRHRINIMIAALVVTMAVILNPALIRRYGFMGAAWATCICSLAGAVASGSYLFRSLRLGYPWVSLAKIMSGAALFFVCATAAGAALPPVRYAAYCVFFSFFIAYLFITGEATGKDLALLRSLFGKGTTGKGT